MKASTEQPSPAEMNWVDYVDTLRRQVKRPERFPDLNPQAASLPGLAKRPAAEEPGERPAAGG